MLNFDPNNPFPLLPSGQYSYLDAQEHSAKVDRWLGLEAEKIEDWLCKNAPRDASGRRQELWVGLPVRSLLTPYTEIRSILEEVRLLPGSTVIDLGAGYGRMGFVIGRHYSDIQFVGYEYVAERVHEGQRCLSKLNCPNVTLEQADLSDPEFKPRAADCYFIYDYGTREAIEKTLEDLRLIAQGRAVTVVGRGRSARDTIERQNPWLSQIVPPRHFGHYSIYRSAIAV